jgi:hypothetical protein
MINLAFKGTKEHNNGKALLFLMTFSGDYGVNGVGDLLDLLPVEPGVNPNGITDPNGTYDQPLAQVPSIAPDVNHEELGGYYCQIQPNAAPSLQNFGVRVYAPGGGELATGAGYPAAVTGGSAMLEIELPNQ